MKNLLIKDGRIFVEHYAVRIFFGYMSLAFGLVYAAVLPRWRLSVFMPSIASMPTPIYTITLLFFGLFIFFFFFIPAVVLINCLARIFRRHFGLPGRNGFKKVFLWVSLISITSFPIFWIVLDQLLSKISGTDRIEISWMWFLVYAVATPALIASLKMKKTVQIQYSNENLFIPKLKRAIADMDLEGEINGRNFTLETKDGPGVAVIPGEIVVRLRMDHAEISGTSLYVKTMKRLIDEI